MQYLDQAFDILTEWMAFSGQIGGFMFFGDLIMAMPSSMLWILAILLVLGYLSFLSYFWDFKAAYSRRYAMAQVWEFNFLWLLQHLWDDFRKWTEGTSRPTQEDRDIFRLLWLSMLGMLPLTLTLLFYWTPFWGQGMSLIVLVVTLIFGATLGLWGILRDLGTVIFGIVDMVMIGLKKTFLLMKRIATAVKRLMK